MKKKVKRNDLILIFKIEVKNEKKKERERKLIDFMIFVIILSSRIYTFFECRVRGLRERERDKIEELILIIFRIWRKV